MDAQQATRSFKQAEALYSNGRHQEALELLETLDITYPNNKNILYPKALCLAALGRNDEARAACDALDALQDARARAVREKLAPPSAGDDDMMALDMDMGGMDILGDFDKPAPKRTPPPQAQAASRMPMLLGIGAAVLVAALMGGVVYSGVLGSLFAPRETVESALAKIEEASSDLRSYTAFMTTETKITEPMPMTMSMSGDIEYLKHDGADMYLMNVLMSMPELGMSQSMKMVNDGETGFVEINIMGQLLVMKVDASAAGAQHMDPIELFDELKAAGELTLLDDETVDGMPAFAFAAKPTSRPEFMQGLSGVQDVKIVVLKESGLPVLIEVKGASGDIMLNVALSRVMTNLPSSPDKFSYTPPPNAEVMDMAEFGDMMPFGMPGL